MANNVNVTVDIPEARQKEGSLLTTRAEQTMKLADSFEIGTNEDFKMAGAELIKIGKSIDAIDSHRKDMTRPIDEAKKKIMDKFKPAIAFLEEAKSTLNRKMMQWRDEQQRKAAEVQRLADEQARKEREKLEEQARKLAAKGKEEQAAAKLAQAATVVAAVVSARPVPQVKGATTRKTWRCEESVDVMALCKAVVDGVVAPIAVSPNYTFLNEQARSLEQHFDARFPGCKATSTEKFGRTGR